VLRAIGAMLPVAVRVVGRMITIMTLRIVLEIGANPCCAHCRADGPIDHCHSEEHDDNLGARWANSDHEPPVYHVGCMFHPFVMDITSLVIGDANLCR
jgi:hypothetical protein